MRQSAAHQKKKVSWSTKFNIDSKCFSGKQNVSPHNVFLFETLDTTVRRNLSETQAVILSSTNNFFSIISTLCNNMWPQVKNITVVYVFLPPSLTLMDNGKHFLSSVWVQKVMSVGCKCRDANLWRPKIGRLSFFYSLPGISTTPPPPPPEKLTQPPMGMT